MAIETRDARDLASFEAPEGFLVTSFYLDINAEEFFAPEHVDKSFHSLIHAAESRRKEIEDGLSHQAEASLRGDLAHIRDFMKDYKREDANGLAIFSCSAEDLWEIFETPTVLTSQFYFEPKPYLAPLATFLSHTKPTAILVTDKQNARIFTMEHGQVKEWSEFTDFVPQRSDQGGWSQMRYQRRSDNWAQHHMDHADELVLKLEQHHPFDWLIIGTQDQYRNEVEGRLHPYVKDRVIGFIGVRIDESEAEIVEKAQRVREEAESHLIDDLLHRVQEYAGAGGRGTIGLEETLGALNEQKVHILLVQHGFSRAGAICPSCGLLLADQPDTCPACNGPAEKLENVVDAAIQRAFELGSQVEVATERERLEPIQNIGSILYY